MQLCHGLLPPLYGAQGVGHEPVFSLLPLRFDSEAWVDVMSRDKEGLG